MRDIKFRAWDKEKKGWIEPHYVDISCAGIISEVTVHRGYEINRERNVANLILMQFTGLKDKNGKEIYEGDILKSTTGDEKEHFQDIYFKDGAFRIRTGFDTTLGCHLYKKRIIAHEIIGNIYENKELIK